jgi:hypothetical protein
MSTAASFIEVSNSALPLPRRSPRSSGTWYDFAVARRAGFRVISCDAGRADTSYPKTNVDATPSISRTRSDAVRFETVGEWNTEEPNIVTIVEILNLIYRRSEENDEHRAVDDVFDFMDDNLLAGNFRACDETLRLAQPSKLLPSVVVSFLMVTRRAKPYLPSRKDFIDAAVNDLALKRGKEQAEKLLGKYR